MNAAKRKLICLEGTIGVGKSTLLERLRQAYAHHDPQAVAMVTEPVKLWQRHDLLGAMYDGRLNGTCFQQLALDSRCHFLRAALRKRPPPSVIVTERSPWSDAHVFAKARITNPHELHCYGLQYELAIDDLVAACDGDLEVIMVYLDAAPDVAQERVRQRDRSCEEDLPSEVFYALKREHDGLFDLLDEGDDEAKTIIDPWRRITVQTRRLDADTLEELDAAFDAVRDLIDVNLAKQAPEPVPSPDSSMAKLQDLDALDDLRVAPDAHDAHDA